MAKRLTHFNAVRSRWVNVILISVCVAVAGIAVTWKAWNMFTPRHRPMLEGWDDSFYYFWLPTVIIDHDLDFSKPLATSGTITRAARDAGLKQPRTETGLLPNKYPPGWALGSLPFFLIGRVLSPAGSTGFEATYLVPVWVGQMLYAIGGLWLAILIIRRLLPRAPATVVVLSVWLASPLVYFQSARVSLSHNQLFDLAMAVFWLTLRIRDGDDRPRVWFGLGLASALMVLTRNITIIYLVFPLLLLIRRIRSWRPLGWFTAGSAGPAAIQMISWKLLFGSWIAYSYGSERFDFSHPHLWGVLFSPWHGWFYWHPLLLVGVVALTVWSFRNRIAIPWLVSLVIITVLNASWPCWWFASSFGNRGFEVPIFFGMFGIAVLFHATADRPNWRRAVTGVVSIAIAWNLVLFALFLTRRIPNETPVTYADDIRALEHWTKDVRAAVGTRPTNRSVE